MYLSDESLRISIDVVDTLFVHALRDSVAQAAPPQESWNHIAQAVQGDSAVRHLPPASYAPLTDMQLHF
jgi:uncharacterized protein YktB (UPF0637 family)